MRWIKHMVASRQDEKVARLVAEHGHAAYGLWWMVLEIVAAKLDGDAAPSVTYHVSTWSHLLSLRGSHVRQAILKLSVTSLVTAEWNGNELTVTIPNLLKYRDEYSKKSGQTPDIVRSKKQKQNTEAEAEFSLAESAPKPPDLFPQFWAAWWNKTAKEEARKAWSAAASRFGGEFLRQAAIDDKARWESREEWAWRSKLHPATWLRGKRWEDQLPPDVAPRAGPQKALTPLEKIIADERKAKSNGT